MKFVEQSFLSDITQQKAYTIHVFGAAFIIGCITLAVKKAQGSVALHWRNAIAGVLLGVPNYFSIYFFIRLLHSDFLSSSAAIPVNNIGIVLLSALVAIFFFKEKATRQRIFGLVLSVIVILLIAFSDLHGSSL